MPALEARRLGVLFRPEVLLDGRFSVDFVGLLVEVPLTNSDLGSDQVHPNEGGYEKVPVVWHNAIKPYLH